jgi:hypothetical protein
MGKESTFRAILHTKENLKITFSKEKELSPINSIVFRAFFKTGKNIKAH